MQRTIVFLGVCLMVIAVFYGFDLSGKLGLNKTAEIESTQPVSSIVLNEEETTKFEQKTPIVLYFSDKEGKLLASERRYITKENLKTDIQTTALSELLKGPMGNKSLKQAVPSDTKLSGPIKIKDGIATINLSTEFSDKFPKDKNTQTLAIFSIVNTLCETKDITGVKFLINGTSKKELGEYKFDGVFQKNDTFINKTAEVFSTGIEDIHPTINNSRSDLKDQDKKASPAPTPTANKNDLRDNAGSKSDSKKSEPKNDTKKTTPTNSNEQTTGNTGNEEVFDFANDLED